MTLNISETFTIPNTSSELNFTKYQKNFTKNEQYNTLPIYCSNSDIIKYKLSLKNQGTSTICNVKILDTLPQTLTFKSLHGSIYKFNPQTNRLKCSIPCIPPSSIVNIIVSSKVLPSDNSSNSTNIAHVSYDNSIEVIPSNSVVLYKDYIKINKYQRNVTTDEAFTKEPIKCFKGQIICYKLIFTNTNNFFMKNVVIKDRFPLEMEFINHSDFTNGTITVNLNVLTCSIPIVQLGETIEYSYNVKLTKDCLDKCCSIAKLKYTSLCEDNIFTMHSNKVCTILTSLGKGFKFY